MVFNIVFLYIQFTSLLTIYSNYMMKRLVYCIVMLIGFSGLLQSCGCIDHIFSGNRSYGGFSFGLTGMPGQESSYTGGAIGGSAGVGTEVAPFGDNTTINAETALSMQGSKYEYSGYGSGTSKGSVNLLYLNFPVLVHHKFGGGFFGEAGIQPGICLSAKDKYNGQSHDYKSSIATLDIGIPIGIGYMIDDKLGIGIRWTEGLNNINKSESNYGTTEKNHNRVIGLRLTFKLPPIGNKVK